MLRRIKNSFSCLGDHESSAAEETGIGCAAAIISSVSGAIESDRAQLAQEAEYYKTIGGGGNHTMLNRCRRKYNAHDSIEEDEDEESDSYGDTEDNEETSSRDSPSFITIDDGKGGIKHIHTPRNTTGGAATSGSVEGEGSFSLDSGRVDPFGDLKKGKHRKRQKFYEGRTTGHTDAKPYPSLGLAGLLRRELSGRHFFSMEPHHEAHSHSRRIVSKKGIVHTERSHLSKRKRRYLSDFFNTMLDIKWRYVLLIFTLSFFLSWFGFAIIWWIMMYLRGDFEPEHLPDRQSESNYIPCVLAIHNFASVYLFSVETQHTIGYGSRQTTERCAEAIFLQSLQSVVGVMIQACMVGTIFAKLSRPKKRAQTLMFTKNAVVCKRDGKLCLIFRVGNMRYTSLVEAHVRAVYVGKRVTEEGEVLPYHQTEMKVGVDLKGEEDTILFMWPTAIIHVIDEESPFYTMTASDFIRKRYEVIVLLEGIVEPTGMSIQTRSSYMPNEILWGYRFVNLLNYRRSTNQYKIDYSAFNKVYKVETPKCSAKQIEEDQQGSDGGDSSDLQPPDTRSPTMITVVTPSDCYSSSPMDLKTKFFQSNTIIPYHQSQAALTPPFSITPARGAAGGGGADLAVPSRGLMNTSAVPNSRKVNQGCSTNMMAENHVNRQKVSHVSMPCLQQVKIVESQPNLQAAISAQYKKALGKW